MFEGKIPLADCESIRAGEHHPEKCSKGLYCNQRYNWLEASCLFISGLVANQIKVDTKLLVNENGEFEHEFKSAINWIVQKDTAVNYKNRIALKSPEAVVFGQACFYFISQNNNIAWKLMRENFEDWSDYRDTLMQIIAKHFDVEVSSLEKIY